MSPSPPSCSHRPPCPGCPGFGRRGPPADAVRAFLELAAEAGLAAPPIATGEASGHRHRARLAVRGRARTPKLGLFEEGSHRIVDIPSCPVHHPAINEAGRLVKEAVRATGTAPYVDASHRGVLRYVQLVVERATQRVQVVLVSNDTSSAAIEPLAERIVERFGARLQGLFWNGQPERSNAILGPHWRRLAGEACVREEIAGEAVLLPPGAFGQSHLPLFDRLAERARALVPDGAHAAELYAGVGAIGIGLLPRVASLHFNERSPDALSGLAGGLALRSHALRARARIFEGAAGQTLEVLAGRDVVLVDPPRRGLDAPLLDALCERPPERLVYVACGRDSFLREARALVERSSLRLAGLELFDLFPYTEHVEALAWFDR